MIAVATFYPEACAGRALIDEGVRIAKADGAVWLWCNARVGAEGPMFDFAPAGKHYVMIKDLT